MHGPGKGLKAAAADGAGASSTIDLTFPQQCNFAEVAIYRDRFTECRWSSWAYNVYEFDYFGMRDVPVGGQTFQFVQWWVLGSQAASSGSLQWGHRLFLRAGDAWGVIAAGADIAVSTQCGRVAGWGGDRCHLDEGPTTEGVPQHATPGIDIEYSWHESDRGSASQGIDAQDMFGVDEGAESSLGVRIHAFGPATYSSNIVEPVMNYWNYAASMRFRCDSYAMKYADRGCININFTPTVDFDATKNPKVSEVAQHIYDAQRYIWYSAWGIPHDAVPAERNSDPQVLPYGGTLQYESNASRANANRYAVCSQFQPTYPEETCDEFPFASSKQGGGNYLYPGMNRWYSIRGVPSPANSSQGATLGHFYNANRLLDNDYFYVNARLANGTWSWTGSASTNCCDSPDVPDSESEAG
jgi:hypothetical protein